ncbi:ZIP family metal transporter [Candidatus Saccharibacteria bacterium]|nr:ZIP family metal transporter [Candidatus Saccharibacteria bacterium]
MEFIILLISTIITAFLSLVGGFLLLGKSKLAGFLNKIGKPFAALVLSYCVFFDLIPESLEDGSLPLWEVIVLTFIGLSVCFLINYLVKNFHEHGEEKELKTKSEAYSMLVVDSLHTITDGLVIGVTFATSLGTGLLACVSTAAHEVPQEIGDFGIMIRSKIPKRRILKLQIASALLLVPSALVSFFIGESLIDSLPPLLALIAGSFLYIALREIFAMIKEVKQKRK